MGLNCGAKVAKYVLFIFNIIFFLGGAAVLGVGIWIRVDTGSYYKFLEKVDPTNQATEITNNILSDNLTYIYAVAYVLIGVGAFVFVVGFLGCCGAIKQWRPLLVSYAICLIIIMGIEIGVGIAVGVYKGKVIETIETEGQKWAKKYNYVPTDVQADNILKPKSGPASGDALMQTNAWNALHVYIGCCGVKDYNDFLGSPYASQIGPIFRPPAFCCRFSDVGLLKLEDGNCGNGIHTRDNSHFQDGCVNKVRKFIEDNAPAVIGVAVGIGLIELVGIIFSFCLCCAIGDKGKRYN